MHESKNMIRKIYFYAIVFALLTTDYLLAQAANPAAAPPPPQRIAIIGDSGATGAVADPTFDLSAGNFLSQIADLLFHQKSIFQPKLEHYSSPNEFRISEPLDPPTRIFFSQDEEQEDDDRTMELKAQAMRKVDIAQFSWGYMVGRALDIAPTNILFAAHDGAVIESIGVQLARLKKEVHNVLPPQVFISFTSNDFCHEDILQWEPQSVISDYYDRMRGQFANLYRYYKPTESEGTKIYWISPLPVVSVLTENDILDKHVPFVDQRVRCRDLREGNITKSVGKFDFVQQFATTCPSIQNTKPSDEARIQKLQSLFAALIEGQKRAIKDISHETPQGFSVEFIDAVTNLHPNGDDIANDCFHPSLQGNEKVAREILKAIGK